MIRPAETTADFERCAEISRAVDPENPVSVETLRGAAEGTLLLDERGGYAYVSPSGGRVSDDASLEFVGRRGFREIARDIVVARPVAPGEGEVAPGVVELRDEHLRGAYDVGVEAVAEVHAPLPAEARPFGEWLEHESRAVNERLGYRPLAPVAIVSGPA